MVDQELNRVAFPVLDPAQLESLAQCAQAKLEQFPDGHKLIDVGERDFRFYVVKSGAIDITDVLSDDEPKVIVRHGPGQFTGDVSHLTGSPSIVQAIAREGLSAWSISRTSLRHVLNQCPQLSDIILQAFIARRQLLRESGIFKGLRVIGSRFSKDTFRIRDFLSKNHTIHTFMDVESDPEVRGALEAFGVSEAETPIVACKHGLMLRNPSNVQLAETLNIRTPLEKSMYDLVVVGAGPTGLAAAVYAASEGLRTLVIERTAPGGQAGSSMRIENYLGFPTGITGAELADRAVFQASKFGAQLSVSVPVTRLRFEKVYPMLDLESGETVVTKCLLIATGADYRRLEVEGCARFEGNGVYYAATAMEAERCQGKDVAVVGGGNSAGQAVVYLAERARKVYVLLRGDDLNKNMSSYLVQRIQDTPNVEILRNTTVRQMRGDGQLEAIEVVESSNGTRGAARTIELPMLFSFIGAVPRTEWLPEEIERDRKGFVLTGSHIAQSKRWSHTRPPFLLETTRPGVFAAGDVRSGSVKRVASAVGEGSMAVQFVHEVLAEI